VRTAVMTNEPFGKLLATGITGMIVIQALFNVSVVLGMLPTKGIPLPLISYGGSSLFISLASIGVLLNITQHTD
jgi:cell division protein FtsW